MINHVPQSKNPDLQILVFGQILVSILRMKKSSLSQEDRILNNMNLREINHISEKAKNLVTITYLGL